MIFLQLIVSGLTGHVAPRGVRSGIVRLEAAAGPNRPRDRSAAGLCSPDPVFALISNLWIQVRHNQAAEIGGQMRHRPAYRCRPSDATPAALLTGPSMPVRGIPVRRRECPSNIRDNPT